MIPLFLSAAALFLVGLLLSAFFSGSEIGFYRATRVRLVLDALGGSVLGKWMLWLVNHPSLFVATTLIGNNLANYLTSAAVVVGADALVGPSPVAELLAPLVLAPMLFLYGELLPKNLFYRAPNLLLRKCGPPFLFFAAVFFPLSVLVWLFNRLLQLVIGQSPQQIRTALARTELQNVFEEGHDAGILQPAQRLVAQNLFAIADSQVGALATPMSRVVRILQDAPKAEALALARRHRVAVLPVASSQQPKTLIGYVRLIDLHLSASPELDELRPLVTVDATASPLSALVELEVADESLAQIVAPDGSAVGIVTAASLREPLLRGR